MAANDKEPDQGSVVRAGNTDDLRRRAASALGRTSVVVLLDRAIQIAFLALLARLLRPDEMAVVAAAGAVVAVTGLIGTLGFPAVLIQASTQSVQSLGQARGVMLLTTTFATMFTILCAPLAGAWFRNPQVTDALRVIAPVLLAPIFYTAALARLSLELRARDVALADLISNLGGAAIVTAPMALMGFGFWSLIGGALAQIWLRTLILCLMARDPIIFGFDKAQMAMLSRKGGGFMLNGLLTRVEADAPAWIIGRYMAAADLGLFSRASSLMNYPAGLFYSIVDRVIFPAVALVQKEPDRLREGALDAVRLTAVFGVPLTVLLFLIGGDLIRLVLGPSWEGAVAPFQILCVAVYFRLANRLNWIILRGLGRAYKLAVLQAILLVLTIIGCALGARHGLAGVACAVVVVTFIGYIASGYMALRAAKASPGAWIAAHAQSAACGVLVIAVVGPTVALLNAADAAPAIVIFCASLAAAAAGFLAARLAPNIFVGSAGMRLLGPFLDLSALGKKFRRRR